MAILLAGIPVDDRLVLSLAERLRDAGFDVSWGDEGSELVPETGEDEQLLESFGTRRVWYQLEGTLSARTFHEPITPTLVAALLPKRVGLQLYADAVRVSSGRVRYRELWLVLESAFGLEGRRLTEALACYPPAVELGFTVDELEDLRRFRGRASHAESRDGIGELGRVRIGTADREGRLKTLVERVVLTKKIWGSRSAEVLELARLTSWVAKDGSLS